MFVVTGDGRLSGFDPVFARLLALHTRPLTLGRLMGAVATRVESTRTLEWACPIGFDQVRGFLLEKPDAIARTTQQIGSRSAASAS